MIIKRFKAQDISTALEQIKDVLGDEAVILNTTRRERRNAEGKTVHFVEVTAAVDPDPRPSALNQASRQVQPPPNQSTTGDDSYKLDNIVQSDEITSLLKELIYKVNRLNISSTTSNPYPEDPPLGLLNRLLMSLGIESELKRQIALAFLMQHKTGTITNMTSIRKWLYSYGLSKTQIASRSPSSRPCWWALIGPTGVGKTTTIAKIAANMVWREGKKGLLITTDTYRLGGVDQLRRYANLLDIPLEVAQDTLSLARIFSENQDKDFILVDTTGRSPWDSRHKQELDRIFDAVPGLEAQALLCATAKHEDIRHIVACYKHLPITGWVLSKTDETRQYGALASAVLGMGLPVSYITTGQKVPEDIEPAATQSLVKLLLTPRAYKEVYQSQHNSEVNINLTKKTDIRVHQESV